MEDMSGSVWMFVGESDQGWVFEYVVEYVELGVFNGVFEQGVMYDFYVYISFVGFFMEFGYGVYGYVMGIGYDSGQGSFGSFVDFSDDGFFVFEFNCYGFIFGCYCFVQLGLDVVLVFDLVIELGVLFVQVCGLRFVLFMVLDSFCQVGILIFVQWVEFVV